MVLDGLPSGGSWNGIQWEFLNMQNLFSTRLANRIAQLFGRINRGRNDFGAFVNGRTLNAWLNRDRFVTLPELLQKQILLGLYVQEAMQITTNDKVLETIATVLARIRDGQTSTGATSRRTGLEAEATARVAEDEERLIRAALAEAEYARAMWEGDCESGGWRSKLPSRRPAAPIRSWPAGTIFGWAHATRPRATPRAPS